MEKASSSSADMLKKAADMIGIEIGLLMTEKQRHLEVQ
jgi:hypothetical protein